MEYTIEELQEQDFDEWNKFVKQNKVLTIFHTIEWKKVIEDTFHFKPIYFVVKNNNKEIVGISPAFIVRSFFKKMIVSMPFFEYGGPFVKEEYKAAYRDIFNRYRRLVDDGGVSYVKIRSLPTSIDYGVDFKRQIEAVDFYFNVENKTFQDVWEGFTKSSNIRTGVKKSRRNGIEIKYHNCLEALYDLITKKDAKLGSPSFPKKFYANLEKYLSDKLHYVTSYSNGKPIASMISLRFHELLLHQLGSDPTYLKKSSTDILFVEHIKYAIETGCQEIDFGRSKPDSNHSFFKKKYNCSQRNIYIYQYPVDSFKNRYEGRKLACTIIKKMPWLFIGTSFGAWLRKNTGL